MEIPAEIREQLEAIAEEIRGIGTGETPNRTGWSAKADPEAAHCDRDELLHKALRLVYPPIADASEEVERTIGFWYA